MSLSARSIRGPQPFPSSGFPSHPHTAMRYVATLLIALMAAGCASGSASIPRSASSTSQERTDFDLPESSGSLETTRRGTVTSETIALPPEEAWKLLVQVYSDLKLPVNTVDTRARLLGVQYQRLQQINGKRARSYFDCGLEYVTGGRDLYVQARTQLEPSQTGGTLARTQVDAYAKSNEGSGGVRCSSTGALETLIGNALQTAAHRQQP